MMRDMLHRGTYRVCPYDLTGDELLPHSSWDYYYVSGGTTITDINHLLIGMQILLDFKTETTLTHSSTLLLPHDTDITAEENSVYRFVEVENGVWKNIAGGGSGGGGSISDAAYSSNWDEDVTVGASKNALYDKIETLADNGTNTDITSLRGMDDGDATIIIGDTNTGGTAGSYNIAIGKNTLASVALGDSYNVGIGENALTGLNPQENVAIGFYAGGTGGVTNSVVIGTSAGNTNINETLSSCVFIGEGTKSNVIDGDNQILIGNAVEGDENNSVVLGGTSINNTYLRGVLNLNGDVVMSSPGDNTMTIGGSSTTSTTIEGNTTFSGTLASATTYLTVADSLWVSGEALLQDDMTLYGDYLRVDTGGLYAASNNFGVEAGSGNVFMYGDLWINANFTVDKGTGNTVIAGTLNTTGDFAINTDKFTVDAATGDTSIAGALNYQGDFSVGDDKFTVEAATGHTTMAGTLVSSDVAGIIVDDDFTVTGQSFLTGNVSALQGNLTIANGDLSVSNKFSVANATGNTDVNGTLNVYSDLTVEDGNLTVSLGNLNVVEGDFTVTTDKFKVWEGGQVDIEGDIYVNTDKFTVNAITGNTSIDGTLDVDGTITHGSKVSQPVIYETTLSGAVVGDLTKRVLSYHAQTSDIILSLADGVEGQEITVYKIGVGYDIVVTPVNFWEGTSHTLSKNGEYVDLIFLGVNWHIKGTTPVVTDYEEGTFTPSLEGSIHSSFTYNSRSGTYTKIGNVVNYIINIDLDDKGNTEGFIQVSGLPFTAKDDGMFVSVDSYWEDLATVANVMAYISPNTSHIRPGYMIDYSAIQRMLDTDIENYVNIRMSGAYRTE